MRSEGDHHDAGFVVSTERNELVEKGRREVGGVTITTPGLGSWRARRRLGEKVARVGGATSSCRRGINKNGGPDRTVTHMTQLNILYRYRVGLRLA